MLSGLLYFVRIMMNTTEIVHRMRKDLYCCYRHFCQGRQKNQQTHCYGHVVKGLILPEGTVGKQLKAKVQQVKEKRRQEASEAKANTLTVQGIGLELKGYGFNITSNENVKPSLPHHLASPFIYCDKVYKKGKRPVTKKQDIFLVAAENTCNRHLRKDIEIQEQLKSMSKEQRREFFSRSFNLTQNMYYFYSNVQKCLDDQLYKERFPELVEHPTLLQLFEDYCRIKNINLQKRHQYMMVDEKEFKQFTKMIGFPKRLYNLIDQFWQLIFKQKIFENYQIPITDSKAYLRRTTSKVISMKAFFYNFRKFYADKNKYSFVFSPNMLRQRNIDLRFELFPWKQRYRFLNYRLKELKPIEFSICERLSQSNKQLSEELIRVIEDRNQKCFKYRVLAKVYYPLVCKTHVNFDNLHQTFANRLERIRGQMELFEEFLEAFKDFRRQITVRQENFDQQIVKATDLADFLAYSKMQSSKSEIVIKWLNKFYKYLHFFKNQAEIQYDINSGKTALSKNIVFNYDEISEFLHYKCTKCEDEQNLVNNFLIRLENFYNQHTQDKELGHSQQIFERNIVAQFLLRQMNADLCSFEKLFSIVKVATPYLEDPSFNQQSIKSIEKILAKNISSQGFTTKFLFSSQIIIVNDNCQACQPDSESHNSNGGNKWKSKISSLMKVFSDQVQSLQHVLLDWNVIKQQAAVLSYPNVKRVKITHVNIEQPQELQLVQQKKSEGKTFNIKYVQIPKQKAYQVKVTKHQHIPQINHQGSVHSAQSAIFEQQKKPKVFSAQEKIHLQECSICKAMVKGGDCQSSPMCGCYICLGRADHFCCRTTNTEDQFSVQSVSDIQDQILRLLYI